MTEELYALNKQQFRDLSKLMLERRTRRRGGISKPENQIQAQFARVIAMTPRGPYDSLTQEELPVFSFDDSRNVWNLSFSGSAVSGYFNLQLLGQSFIVDVARSHLTDLETLFPGRVRINVFPGVWEFEFFGTQIPANPVDSEAIRIDQFDDLCQYFDQDALPILNGSRSLRREGWVSERTVAGEVLTVAVRDAIPYSSGQISPGSIGFCTWNWDAGWTASAWECRQFSAGSVWVADDDPYYPARPQ